MENPGGGATPGSARGTERYFFFAFGLVVLAFLLGTDQIAARFFPAFSEKINSTLREEMAGRATNRKDLRLEKISLAETKARHFFWLANGRTGFGLDVLGNAPLTHSLFPGYGETLRRDQNLWREYFQLDFSPSSFLGAEPYFSEQGFLVSYSWTGCFRIFEKYGADILVFGTSEVYEGLVASEIGEALKDRDGKIPRVLFCPNYGSTTEIVRLTAKELARLAPKKPRAILWGYSFWLAYHRSKVLAGYTQEKQTSFDHYVAARARWGEPESPSRRWLQKLKTMTVAELFPKATWDQVVHFNFQEIKERQKQTEVDQDPNRESVILPRALLEAPAAELDAYLSSHLKPYYSTTVGINESDCALSRAQPEFTTTLRALGELAPRVFLYIPPTSDHHQRAMPGCFLPAVRKMVETGAREAGAHFLSLDREGFGLTNRDFVWAIPTEPDQVRFDINHTSFRGAQKVTSQITRWMAPLWREP